MAQGDGAWLGGVSGASWGLGLGDFPHPSPLPGGEGACLGVEAQGLGTLTPSHQVVKDVPQPQEDFAFGFSNLKPAPVTDVT